MSKVNTLCSICESEVTWECEAIQCDIDVKNVFIELRLR